MFDLKLNNYASKMLTKTMAQYIIFGDSWIHLLYNLFLYK